MKYLCNEEGVASLRQNAEKIKTVISELNEQTFSIKSEVVDLAEEGDNPAEQIKEIFEQLVISVDNLNDATETVRTKLTDVADGFEEIIAEKAFK